MGFEVSIRLELGLRVGFLAIGNIRISVGLGLGQTMLWSGLHLIKDRKGISALNCSWLGKPQRPDLGVKLI